MGGHLCYPFLLKKEWKRHFRSPYRGIGHGPLALSHQPHEKETPIPSISQHHGREADHGPGRPGPCFPLKLFAGWPAPGGPAITSPFPPLILLQSQPWAASLSICCAAQRRARCLALSYIALSSPRPSPELPRFLLSSLCWGLESLVTLRWEKGICVMG